jgi:polysaccharide export outer membrane protein
MRKLTFLYLFFAIFVICTSCSNKQYQVLFQQRNALADTTSAKTQAVINQYRIKPQDILQIRNLQGLKYIVDETPVNPTTTTGGGGTGTASQGQTFQVDEDGTVALPALGHVQVSGLTRSEAQKLVEDLYRKSLLVNPIIDLKIVNLKVTILGEIRAQGNYVLLKDKTTLVEVIGEAGGLTERANDQNIKIIRGTTKNPEVTEINLEDIRSINDPKTILQSGDIIYVAQNKRAARNDNFQNFSEIVQPALILFNTALIIFTLVRK